MFGIVVPDQSMIILGSHFEKRTFWCLLKCETDWRILEVDGRKCWAWRGLTERTAVYERLHGVFVPAKHGFQMLLPFQVGLWSIFAMAQTCPRRSMWIQHQTHMDTPNMSYPDAFLKVMNVNLVRSWSSSFRMLLAIQQVQKQVVIGQYLHIIKRLHGTQH